MFHNVYFHQLLCFSLNWLSIHMFAKVWNCEFFSFFENPSWLFFCWFLKLNQWVLCLCQWFSCLNCLWYSVLCFNFLSGRSFWCCLVWLLLSKQAVRVGEWYLYWIWPISYIFNAYRDTRILLTNFKKAIFIDLHIFYRHRWKNQLGTHSTVFLDWKSLEFVVHFLVDDSSKNLKKTATFSQCAGGVQSWYPIL